MWQSSRLPSSAGRPSSSGAALSSSKRAGSPGPATQIRSVPAASRVRQASSESETASTPAPGASWRSSRASVAAFATTIASPSRHAIRPPPSAGCVPGSPS